jgi:hypothetical protein
VAIREPSSPLDMTFYLPVTSQLRNFLKNQGKDRINLEPAFFGLPSAYTPLCCRELFLC